MLDITRQYETTDGRHVTLINKKLLNGTLIFVGNVEGQTAYQHWDEQGRVFGDRDKHLNLKAPE